MKLLTFLYILLLTALGISGCVPTSSTTVLTQTETPISLPVPIHLTTTSTFTPVATVTTTLPATLEPEKAKESIRMLLQEPIECKVPCFWGVVPGQTTLDEAVNIFAHLGLNLKFTATLGGKDFYQVVYNLGNGIEVSPVIAVQNNLVLSIDIGINDVSQAEISRKWSAYSPETLINQYGSPSRVDFFLGRVAPTPIHSMILYFDALDLIVEYSGADIVSDVPTLGICPLTNQVDLVRIWIGDDLQYPPSDGIPLEEATSLTMEEFTKLMVGDPEDACFSLKGEAFP